MRFFKKIFKVFGVIVLVVFFIFLVLINIFFKPKSDNEIQKSFKESNLSLSIEHKEFEGYKYRLISTRKKLDTTLPNLVFIHGSPGSALDYEKYLKDEFLNLATNMIAYDRVGYGAENEGEVKDIAFEVKLLNSITDDLDISNTILVGYSYGGPIALASKKMYKKIVLPAPAVYSVVEPMFWFLNFYKWRATRWLLPKMLQAASKEKIQHREDLKKYQENWGKNLSPIYAIHGDKDWIVPIDNSEYLSKQFDEECFELLVLEEAGHDLIWSRFETIKSELLKVIKE